MPFLLSEDSTTTPSTGLLPYLLSEGSTTVKGTSKGQTTMVTQSTEKYCICDSKTTFSSTSAPNPNSPFSSTLAPNPSSTFSSTSAPNPSSTASTAGFIPHLLTTTKGFVPYKLSPSASASPTYFISTHSPHLFTTRSRVLNFERRRGILLMNQLFKKF